MSTAHVRRTLVKSPPELWAELSDPESLSRHLGEFGEIRITDTRPETTVAWEGERASGTVELEPSGWGTSVSLRVTLTGAEPPEREQAEAQDPPDRAVEGMGVDERAEPAQPAAAGPQDIAPSDALPVGGAEVGDADADLPAPEAQPSPGAGADEPTEAVAAAGEGRRRGAWRRLVALWHRRWEDEVEVPPAEENVPVAPSPSLAVTPAPEALTPSTPQANAPMTEANAPSPQANAPGPQADAALTQANAPAPQADAPLTQATLPPAQANAPTPEAPDPEVEKIEGMLRGVLDTLGMAHHRPFSRG